jgi:Ras-related GTP-binding protein A/B
MFMEQYFQAQREHIFKNVEVLIFVFDITSKDIDGDIKHYESCLSALNDLSKQARIFCLIHKMDLIEDIERE